MSILDKIRSLPWRDSPKPPPGPPYIRMYSKPDDFDFIIQGADNCLCTLHVLVDDKVFLIDLTVHHRMARALTRFCITHDIGSESLAGRGIRGHVHWNRQHGKTAYYDVHFTHGASNGG